MSSEANLEEIQPQQGQAHSVSATDEGTRSYALSKEGRRAATILLLGVASIWIFALWSLITILDGGISGIEWVSALLMLGILVVAPMVAWTLLEEINSRISVGDSGLRYQALGGIDLTYKWDELEGFEQAPRQRGKVARFFLGKEERASIEAEAADAPDDVDEPGTDLLRVRDGASPRIGNTIVSFLHTQAHGPAVPIYGGIENREELLGEIRARLQGLGIRD